MRGVGTDARLRFLGKYDNTMATLRLMANSRIFPAAPVTLPTPTAVHLRINDLIIALFSKVGYSSDHRHREHSLKNFTVYKKCNFPNCMVYMGHSIPSESTIEIDIFDLVLILLSSCTL